MIQSSVDISLDVDSLADVELDVDRGADITLDVSSGSSGKNLDYNHLANKPKINGSTLIGDKNFDDLGLINVTEQEIDNIIFGG